MTGESKCGCVVKLAVALGLTMALWVFVIGLVAMHGYGTPIVALMGSVYVGYAATWLGSLMGAAWAFVDTVLFILVAGFFYCLLGKCCGKGCSTQCHPSQGDKV